MLFLLSCITLGVVLGCGGGGGGTGNTLSGVAPGPCTMTTALGSVSYTTLWGNSPSAASQVIQIIDADGFTLRSDSVNRNSQPSSNLLMSNITAGTHILKATVYSGANASGSVIGVSTMIVDLCAVSPGAASVFVTTQYGVTPSSLAVAPASITMKQESNVQFVATARLGDNAIFLPQNDVSWSVVGSIGGVGTGTGQFTAMTVGTGSVKATSASTSLVGSGAVQVTAKTTVQTKWTILVYLNAANDLFSYSTLNMNQMEQVASNPQVRFVVQWKQSKSAFSGSTFDGVRRYLVKQDSTSAINSELVQNNLRDANGDALDMGDPQTLNDFIEWGMDNYPADRYCLILWNHGNGWKRSVDDASTRAFSYDDQYGTSIKSWETDAAFAGHHLDIIAWDASLMQMMEVAYEIRGFADYVVGSEESPPGEGYPYHLVFDNFRDAPDSSTANLAGAFVQGMQEQAGPGNLYQFRKITQSAIDTSKLGSYATAVSALADQLIVNRLTIASQIQTIRNNAQSYSPGPSRVYRDIVDVCLLLEADVTIPISVRNAAANVRAMHAMAVVSEYHNAESPKSNGLAIDFSSTASFAAYRSDYLRMKLSADTSWDDWLSVAP